VISLPCQLETSFRLSRPRWKVDQSDRRVSSEDLHLGNQERLCKVLDYRPVPPPTDLLCSLHHLRARILIAFPPTLYQFDLDICPTRS